MLLGIAPGWLGGEECCEVFRGNFGCGSAILPVSKIAEVSAVGVFGVRRECRLGEVGLYSIHGRYLFPLSRNPCS